MKYYGIQNEVKIYANRMQSEQGITIPSSVLKTLNDRVESLKKATKKLISYTDIDTIYKSL